MGFDDPGDKAKAQAEPRFVVWLWIRLRVAFSDAIEAVEDVRDIGGIHAEAMIFHQQLEGVAGRAEGDRDESASVGVLDRVGDEIGDEPFELDSIALHDSRRWKLDLNANSTILAGHLKLLAQLLQQSGQVNGLVLKGELAAFGLGELK